MKQKPTRYEINQKIKRILVSHGADLRQLTYSFSGKTAWFSGQLLKINGQEMANEEVENLGKALGAMPEILYMNFELENWVISSGTGALSVARKNAPAATSVRERKPLVITTDETVEEVLKETL
ncbi:MAG: hypothetical protein HUN04_16360 [Desulfobacter sp.]|nr:MAG: hypothetical protein HUN04_16360 [Desulfobacter sp.]